MKYKEGQIETSTMPVPPGWREELPEGGLEEVTWRWESGWWVRVSTRYLPK